MSEPAAPEAPRRTPWKSGLVGLALSALFLWLALRNVDADGVLTELRKADLRWLVLTIPVKALGFLVGATRQRILFAARARAPLSVFLGAGLVGFAGNNLLPLRLGEVLRIRHLGRRLQQPYMTCVAVVAFERLTDLAVLLTATALMLPILTAKLSGADRLHWYYAVVAALALAVFLLARYQDSLARVAGTVVGKVSRRFREVAEAMVRSFAAGFSSLSSRTAVATVLLLTAGSWTLMCVNAWIVLQAMSLSLPAYAPLAILIFLSLGTALPSSPAFIGSYHWFASSALVLLFAVEKDTALSFAIVLHAAATLPFTLIALPWLWRELSTGFRRRDPASAPASAAPSGGSSTDPQVDGSAGSTSSR